MQRSQDRNRDTDNDIVQSNHESIELTSLKEPDKEGSTSDTVSITSSNSNDDDTDILLSEADLEPIREGQCHDEELDDIKIIDYRKKMTYRSKKLLIRGSFLVIGISILVAGGVSSRFKPHVDINEYSNCSTAVICNDSLSVYCEGNSNLSESTTESEVTTSPIASMSLVDIEIIPTETLSYYTSSNVVEPSRIL